MMKAPSHSFFSIPSSLYLKSGALMLMMYGFACAFAQPADGVSSPSQPSKSANAKPSQRIKTMLFSCRVLYEPARSVWVRSLELDHDAKSFTALRIDGVAVYGFAVEGAKLVTHLDNERIFIDLAVPNWKSQFRDQASGEGVCVKNKL